jgi:hypothetical protein
MAEITNKQICACFDLGFNGKDLQKFFKDVLKKIPNSFNFDTFSDEIVGKLLNFPSTAV